MNLRQGTGVSIQGSVIDVRFPQSLPEVYSLLKAGEEGCVAIEGLGYFSSEVVRGIALTLTKGLARGFVVIITEPSLASPSEGFFAGVPVPSP